MLVLVQDRLVGRWLADPVFRAEVRADLAGALRRAGFNLTGEEVAALRRIPWHLSDAELMTRARSLGSIDKIW
jgi:hypothetical protein